MRNKKSIGLKGGPNEIIVDPRGQWNHPGKNTRIESNQITMQGVEYPVWAQPNVGPGTMMMPGSQHYFKNADYVDEYPMAQDGTEIPDEAAVPEKSFLYDLEKLINKSLGDINKKAKNFSENPEEMNNIDNMRHASGGRYAAEAIQQKVRDLPYVGGLLDFVGVDKAAGFIGANAMGIGHELRTIFGGDERPFLAKLQEMGEDTFNNYVGSIVGSLSIDDTKKDEVIKYLSYNNLLPDGYVRTEEGKKDGLSENIYFKDPDGNIKRPEYQRGGSALPKAQDGIKTIKLDEVDVTKPKGATISQYEEPGFFENLADILANPMTAFGYTTRNQDVPDRLNVNNPNRNSFDSIIDTINPFAWAQYAESANDNIEKGSYVDAGLDSLGAIPIIPAWLSKSKNIKGPIKEVVKKVKDIMKPGDEMVEVFTSDGSKKLIKKADAVRLNRIEDANVNNSSFKNYEDGNWFSDDVSEFYLNNAKNSLKPGMLTPQDPKRLFSLYLDPSDAKAFNVASGTATKRALNMSGGVGNLPISTEYVIPPSIVQSMRANQTGRGFSTMIGNSENIMSNLLDFYKKLGGSFQDAGEVGPETWQDTINFIDENKLKRAIAQAESLNGKLMKNPDSTASGLYGQRFSELEKGELYDGTRDEFIADLDAQNRIFGIRLNEGLKSNKTTPLLKDAFDLMNEYKPQIKDFNFSYEDIIALSNFLGRQGTREYFGNVIRDGRTLSDVYPKLYGESIKQANKTPTEYLDITRPYYKKQYGNGEERSIVAQDNTRVVRPRLSVLPDLNFKPNTPLQDFLNTADPTKLNDDYGNDRVVARDNTSVATPRFDKIDLPTNQIGPDDYEKIMSEIQEEEKLIDTPYDSPNLIADFIRKSNEYSRGWKDMSNASETEIKDLQEVLLNKGYNIGRTGVDGIYGRKTYSAHQAMVDDLNLNPTSISRYHKKYSLDTKQEVMGIQQKLVDEGYLSPTLLNRNASSIDGKFGDQTKEALDAYNTANTEEDPQALVFDFIPSRLEETRCAAGMCTILEGNQVMTDALGVKYKDAWDIFENMDKTKNSNTIFNIYDDAAFKNVNSVKDLKRITKQVKRKKQTKASDYEVGDIVGLYWDGSSHHEETLNSKTHNTHSGFVSDIVDGVPIITHNVNGSVRQQPYNELTTAWIRRPNENLDIKSKYNVDGIEDVEVNTLAIQNLAFRYSGSGGNNVKYEGERLEQLQDIFKRAKYNSLKIPKILNSSVDPNWLESTVIGITGVETGVGSSVPRSRDDVSFVKGVVYDLKGKQDKDISLGIGKTKLASLDSFAKEYFDITSVKDFEDDNKGLDAITYMITKNYELFKDYAKEYPSLGLTETDIRNMAILAYNQGSSRLLKTGRVDDDRTSQEEVEALRELYDATLADISSTNYKHIPGVGQQVFDIAQAVGLEKPADSYIKKVNSYRSDLFPETFATIEEDPSPFEMSSMAQGGEYGVYNNYISGKYDGTYREKSATELYNKLNAKHYQEAKQQGMSVPNFIMTELIKDS